MFNFYDELRQPFSISIADIFHTILPEILKTIDQNVLWIY